MSEEEQSPRCQGIKGWLFGHKFIMKAGGLMYESTVWQTSTYCLRCGWSPK